MRTGGICALALAVMALTGCQGETADASSEAKRQWDTSLAPKLELGVLEHGFHPAPTGKGVEFHSVVWVKNQSKVPVSSVLLRVNAKSPGQPAVTSEWALERYQSCGNFTTNLLLPAFRTRQVRFRVSFPELDWTRDLESKVEVAAAETFEYKSDLRNPEKLQAFIYCEDSETVLKAFDRDPELLKVRTRNGFTPLMMSLAQSDPDLCRELEGRGAGQVTDTSKQGVTTLHLAAFMNPQIVDWVASRGVKPSVSKEGKRSPLDYAIEIGNKATVKALLRAGCSPNTQDRDGRTPLLNAIIAHQPEIVAALKQAGGRFDIRDNEGLGAMGTTIRMTSHAMREPILKLGGSLREVDPKTGQTLLHLACRLGQGDDIQWLVQRGAKLDAKDKQGMRPLDYAERVFTARGAAELWRDYFSRAAYDRNAPLYPN